jgi:plastocyanin
MMGGYGVAPTAPAGASARMAESRFEPSTLAVPVRETVRWFNDDALPHTVSATDGSCDSGNLPPGASFERRFQVAGNYPYVCPDHPGMAAGTIEVQGP